MAFAMNSIVSGGKDACEKSFMGSDYVEFGRLIAQALHQPHQVSRRFNGSQVQTRAKPFTDFLADRCPMEAPDLSLSLWSGVSHENPIVRENAEEKCLPTGSHKTGFRDIFARAGPLHAG
jgi:hypothetical protein